MRLYKIWAMMFREFKIFMNLRYKPIEMLYLPITTIIIWGLFSLSLKSSALETGLVVLIVEIFWSFAYIAQSATNLGMMDDSWSGSLKNIFVSGISSMEYLVSRIISSALTALAMMFVILAIAYYVFNAYIIALNLPLILSFMMITLLGSIALSAMIAGLILYLGKEYGFVSWTALQIFILLSAPFYPVAIFPELMQPIAWLMPFTNVFEGLRTLISTGAVNTVYLINGFLISLAYIAIGILFYLHVFKQAKKNGNLVKLGTW